jgi:mono/diheme cytochrome c family protein
MKPALLGGALLAGAALFGAGPVAAQTTVDTTHRGAAPDSALLTPAIISAGRAIFHGRGTCFGCHGDKLQGGPIAPPLTGASWRHINGNFDAILNRIDEGMKGTLMPSHPGGISESQVFLVATYVYAVSHHLAPP